MHESERLEALKHALHCTILASAGKHVIYALMNSRLPLLNILDSLLLEDLAKDYSSRSCPINTVMVNLV